VPLWPGNCSTASPSWKAACARSWHKRLSHTDLSRETVKVEGIDPDATKQVRYSNDFEFITWLVIKQPDGQM